MLTKIKTRSNDLFFATTLSLGFGFIGVFILMVVTFLADPNSQTVALLFPINHDKIETFAAVIQAQGTPVNFGAFDNILIAKFETKDVSIIIKKTGALTALNPTIPGICTPFS